MPCTRLSGLPCQTTGPGLHAGRNVLQRPRAAGAGRRGVLGLAGGCSGLGGRRLGRLQLLRLCCCCCCCWHRLCCASFFFCCPCWRLCCRWVRGASVCGALGRRGQRGEGQLARGSSGRLGLGPVREGAATLDLECGGGRLLCILQRNRSDGARAAVGPGRRGLHPGGWAGERHQLQSAQPSSTARCPAVAAAHTPPPSPAHRRDDALHQPPARCRCSENSLGGGGARSDVSAAPCRPRCNLAPAAPTLLLLLLLLVLVVVLQHLLALQRRAHHRRRARGGHLRGDLVCGLQQPLRSLQAVCEPAHGGPAARARRQACLNPARSKCAGGPPHPLVLLG